MVKGENSIFEVVTDQMTVDFYVFGSFVKYRIGGYMNNHIIVTVESCGTILKDL